MRSSRWILAFMVAVLILAGTHALAQGNGHGKGHEKHGDDNQSQRYYTDTDSEAIRGWYDAHQNSLPPGLAKKDQLPPGLEKKLVQNGTLPPGLQKRLQPCPRELEQRLPPPPPDCVHRVLGGHIVLLNRKTNIVLDVFHFENR